MRLKCGSGAEVSLPRPVSRGWLKKGFKPHWPKLTGSKCFGLNRSCFITTFGRVIFFLTCWFRCFTSSKLWAWMTSVLRYVTTFLAVTPQLSFKTLVTSSESNGWHHRWFVHLFIQSAGGIQAATFWAPLTLHRHGSLRCGWVSSRLLQQQQLLTSSDEVKKLANAGSLETLK